MSEQSMSAGPNYKTPTALWLDLSPSLGIFHQPLLRVLRRQECVAQWRYRQDADESGALEPAIALLHEYVSHLPKPVHLIGHGTSGTVGLLYARRFPERVRSLTLLGVGVQPAVDWHAHYYAVRELMPCSREMVLAQMAGTLFGDEVRTRVRLLVSMLEQDLDLAASPHSLWQRERIPIGGVPVPLLTCGSADDAIVDPGALRAWETYFKPGDRRWECPSGRHFFHYRLPHCVDATIKAFWQSLADRACLGRRFADVQDRTAV
ncbi:alpha/beta fold hydrolase [Rubidibacter lacunae]|uniref:alpha/beta fold hydrolase n=1 Tax=Rubidibacter lacunae TaxID=582514 RepID=UPI00041A4B55|nr:alpha/beta hydrolase [Rubidibacter lacunae]